MAFPLTLMMSTFSCIVATCFLSKLLLFMVISFLLICKISSHMDTSPLPICLPYPQSCFLKFHLSAVNKKEVQYSKLLRERDFTSTTFFLSLLQRTCTHQSGARSDKALGGGRGRRRWGGMAMPQSFPFLLL